MWRLLLGTMGVKSLVQGLNAAATAGFEPKTVWSEVRRRNRLATTPTLSGWVFFKKDSCTTEALKTLVNVLSGEGRRAKSDQERREKLWNSRWSWSVCHRWWSPGKYTWSHSVEKRERGGGGGMEEERRPSTLHGSFRIKCAAQIQKRKV